MKTNTHYARHYKGHFITRLFPSGYYEAYIGDHFIKADTLQGIKAEINDYLKKQK